MLKRIIFDVDGTLIKSPIDCLDKYQELLDKYRVDTTVRELYKVVGSYERCQKYKYYDKDKLLKLISNKLGTELPMLFLDECIKIYESLDVELLDGVYNTLEYLSDKYELIVLSNWFTESQKKRLKKGGILEFFDEVYGTDIIPMKPIKESYAVVLGNYKPNECMIVGDSIIFDIEVPYELGMQVCYISKQKHDKYLTIDKISKLKEML